jgi:hypothetical protein
MTMRLFTAPILVVCFFFPSFPLAQDAKLIADGKKKGKVVIYGSMETDIFEGIQKAFEKRTGINVDYWRAAGGNHDAEKRKEYRKIFQ